jgi:tripartite-type tricarboxylate transporter receptor subunit TctC
MRLPRRGFLQLAAGAGVAVVPRLARAQAYPSRPVRMLVGYAPGGVADIVGRLAAQWLSERLGRQFFVENRPGAAGNIATEAVVKSPPDGYTLLVIGSNNAINAGLYDALPFDFIRDVAPVAGLVRSPLVMEVHPSVPARTVAEFIPMPGPTPARSTWARAATEARRMWRASCSS